MQADLTADLANTGTPLSVHQCDWVLYACGADDSVLSQLAAGFAERIAMAGEFARKPLQYQGAKFSQVWHDDESHTVEIFRPVLVQGLPARQAVTNLVTAARNQRCGLVVRWFDPGERVWWMRSYFGISLQPAKVDGDGGGQHGHRQMMHAELRMRAERMAETVGSGAEPVMSLVQTGTVVWIDGVETLTLYNYMSGAFQPADLALLAGRATVDFSTPGQCNIKFNGVTKLSARADGTHCISFDGSGPTYASSNPRLEFWMNGVRRATLAGDGTLTAPNLTDANPDDDQAMNFTDAAGHVLLAIAAQVTSPGFFDDL